MATHDTPSQEAQEDPEVLVGLLERQLRSEPALSEREQVGLRLRLSVLYLEGLGDPLSAAVHVEEILRTGPIDPQVLHVAHELLKCRPIAARIAEKLSSVYARLNEHELEADLLSVELTIAKPERLAGVRRRLAHLRLEKLGDPGGAMELLGAIFESAPDDADALARYLEVAASLERTEAAISVLSSVHERTTGLSRARLGHALGLLHLQEGELPSAREAFLSAVREKVADDTVLASARRLIALSRDPEDPAELGPALEVIAAQETDVAERQIAAERLLALGLLDDDDPRSIPAWQALLESARADEALGRLERLYEKAGNKDGLAATLHVRALRTADGDAARALSIRSVELRSEGGGDAALEAWNFVLQTFGPAPDVIASAASVVEHPERERAAFGLSLSGRVLAAVASRSPKELPGWITRTRHVARAARDRKKEAQLFFEAVQACTVDCPERAALAIEAVDLLSATGRSGEALGLALHALETWPGSLALSDRIDRLTEGREPPDARLARYEALLEHLGDESERRRVRHAMAKLARDAMGDLKAAAAQWRVILADDPADERAVRGLVEAFQKTGDDDYLPPDFDRVMSSLGEAEKSALLAVKARSLMARGEREAAFESSHAVVALSEASDEALETVATLAYDENEHELYREVLERLANSESSGVRVHALERLGNYFEQVGNRRAAAESWKPAAMLAAGDDEGNERARELYERVLVATPDDVEAASRLLELYVSAGRWVNVPGVFAVLLHGSSDATGIANKLLALEGRAVLAGAADELVGMIDETMPYLDSTNEDVRRSLMLFKARVLGADEGRLVDAARAYRALAEATGDPEAISAYETFVESRLDGRERHVEKRWLFELRSARAEVSIEALLAWGAAEEEQGETLAAIRAYERAAELCPARDEPLESLARVRAAQGDYEGALAALRTVRVRASAERSGELDLRIARLLGEELGKPEEALVTVASLLSSSPPSAPAVELARRALERPEELDRTVEIIERASRESRDPAAAAKNLELLLEAPLDEASLGDRRESWVMRLAELKAGEPDEAIAVLAKGLAEEPTSVALWDAFITCARDGKRADAVFDAFARAVEHPSVDTEAIDRLGRRVIAFYDEWSSDSVEVQKTLELVLEHVPGAEWALHRVKLLLFAAERWPTLFRFYDRAVDFAHDTAERAALLDEAALAARDVARDPDRAIGYLEQLRSLRPDDAPVIASLERLYERQGESAKLIELLSEHERTATGIVKEELKQRIAGLWLDLGDLGSAHALVESMLEDGTRLADVAGLLERILRVRPEHDVFESSAAPHSRAVALLVEHFESLARIHDVIRIREIELSFARTAEHRKRVVESLVGLHLEAGGDGDDAFAEVIPKVAAFGERDQVLGRAAAERLLELAEDAWKRRGSSAENAAAQAAYWAIRKLEDFAIREGDAQRAVRVLLEGEKLPFAKERARSLVRDAAIHLDDRVGAKERASELFRRLFEEDPTDAVVTPHTDRFSRLLETVSTPEERAELWESLGTKALSLEEPAHARRYNVLAAELWESSGDVARAIGTWRRSAALGSDAALLALARLHRERDEFRPAAEALEWAFASAPAEAKPRLGSLLADAYLALGERDSAEARLEAVLEARPGADDVRARLADLYREDGAYRPLAELLVKGGEVLSNPEQRLAVLREAAQVFLTKLSEPARAIPILETAATLAGSDGELALSRAEALDAAGRHADAAAVLGEQLALHGELRPKSRAPIHHRLSQVLLHMKNDREALDELRAATEIDPSNPKMLYDLGRLALAQGDLGLAESTYRALLLSLHRDEPGEGPSRVEVYLDLSEVAARRDDHARAADYIESSFDVSLEGLEEALRLEKALAARGRDDLVARSVERRLRAAKEPLSAAQALSELLKLHEAQRDAGADLPATIARHAAEIGKQVELKGVTDSGVWATLAAAAFVGGGDGARAAVLARRVELLAKTAEAEEGDAALALLRDAAVSCERDLGDPERARRTYEAIVSRFPSDWDSWDALFRLAGAKEGDKLGKLLEKAVTKLKAVPDRSRLRLGLAKILLADNVQRATRVLEKLLDDEPGHAEALELLADALERTGKDDKLVELLETRARSAREASGGRIPEGLALRLGAALERTGDNARAIEVYDAIVGDASADLSAVQAVCTRLEALSAPSLADCLERLLEAERGPAAKQRALHLVALRDEAGDREGALRAAAFGFQVDPADASLRARLVREYESRGLVDSVRDVLGRAVAVAPEDRPLFLAWVDAALRSGDGDGAIAALDRALDEVPSDTELLRERARAKQEAGRDEDALADLERAYDLDPSFAFEVRSVLERLVERDAAGREQFTLSLVDVLLEQDEQDRAGELLERFLDEHPEDVGALERLAALHAESRDWAVAIAAYERLLPLVGGDDEQFARLSLAFAEACDRAGGSVQARAALERAYEHAPDRTDIRERLEAIYEAEGDRSRLAELLRAGASRADSDAKRAALYFRAAELLLDDGEAERAFEAVSSGRAADPAGAEGSLLLAKVLRSLDRDAEALAELIALAERSRGKPGVGVSRIHLEIGRIYLDSDYLHEGFDALRMAFQLDPRNVEAAYLLGLTAIDLCDEATASRALRAVTAAREDRVAREKKAMAFYHLARLAQWKSDKRRAQTMAKSALSENPDCDVAKALLESLTH